MPHPISTAHTSPHERIISALANTTLYDRILGTVVGSALGDAIGLYTEFLTAPRAAATYPERRFSLVPATPFARDMHRLKHQLGEWTDDTDHALLILLSFLHGSLSPGDVAARLHIWVEQGLRALDTLPLGLGATVGAIVRDPAYLQDPGAAAHRVWVKGGCDVAPNGSLMRTHPLGVVSIFQTEAEAMDAAAAVSAITHVDPRCVVSCMICTALVRGLIRGQWTEEAHIDAVIERAVTRYRDVIRPRMESEGTMGADEPTLDLDELRKHTHAASLAALDLDGRGIGYVYKALGAAILLLRQAMRRVAAAPSVLVEKTVLFEPLITELVMAAGDADTNAAVAGALLGAYVGFAALPGHWREGLRHAAWLVRKAEGVGRILGVVEGGYTPEEDTAPDGGRAAVSPEDMERRWMELQARMAAENTAFLEKERRRGSENKEKRWFRR
ncbi:ADP-ribosylglycohydrolase [Cutaneotrichosporon oleaginosum]|uniref:ADP-ribosylglycohydrolase n=1 Tax=Cutaneotrichosporon oleaginosum TaxID=879819 RepID=A0A0J0XUF0_9TREE|nr:ADP-ribosylglycohydrolase [Cutaneotrichosporon oleaginosum]KLT44731.1 ADP-ribosylglycohydrolase [Cutaneotrichosporon oleaginosum]TXT07717.1 hypothetical protein COLE_04641 [Cutaneotrichosporon oleaginosum]